MTDQLLCSRRAIASQPWNKMEQSVGELSAIAVMAAWESMIKLVAVAVL